MWDKLLILHSGESRFTLSHLFISALCFFSVHISQAIYCVVHVVLYDYNIHLSTYNYKQYYYYMKLGNLVSHRFYNVINSIHYVVYDTLALIYCM